MTSCDARLTAAGFIGELQVREEPGGLTLTGPRAPANWVRGRFLIQWVLAALGLAGAILGIDGAFYLLLAAPLFSFVAYLALWWVAQEQTVGIVAGPSTTASTGWVLRWHDVIWLGSFLTALLLVASATSTGPRIVSFRGPSPTDPTASVRYIVVAKQPGSAALLTATLLGLAPDGSA